MPQMATIPFGEWRPDVALLDNQFASVAENVYPGANAYLPVQSLAAVTTLSLGSGGNDSFTKVLLHMDGADASTTFTDSNTGGSAHTWTARGNAQIDTADSKFGGASGLYDGTGDWVDTPDSADFTLGSGPFTIDGWFKCNAAGGTTLNIAGQNDAGYTAAASPWSIKRSTANVIQVIISDGASFTVINGTTQFTNAVNTGWHHYELVRTGNTLKLFIDGVQEGGDASFSGTLPDSANTLSVGRAGEVAGSEWNGWLDEFRLSVGIARHTQAFTPPTGAYFLGGTACGLTFARTASGSYVTYAGTQTKLFKWSGTWWTDVSRTGGNYNVASGDAWSFQQSGTKLVAVNINDAPQVIDIDSGTNFAALGGSPPQASHVAQVGDFLVLSGLSSNRRKIQWSAINDITGWTIGTNLSDEQEFPDGGLVVGVAGGEVGVVVQDRTIRLMQFLPGDTSTIFAFSRIEDKKGCIATQGFGSINRILYFLAEDGFYAFNAGGLNPIGANKANEWFLANSDPTRRSRVRFFAVPHKPRVVWAFHSNSSVPSYDRLIIYDWSLDRWAPIVESALVWAGIASSGIDLDTSVSGDANDALLDSSSPSLDSEAYVGGRPVVGAIDENGLLSFLDGPNLAATIETAEWHLTPGYRSFVSEVYPLIDARSLTIQAGTRERLQDATVWGNASSLAATGTAYVLSSSRTHRFRANIPANETWTYAQGVKALPQPDGEV